MYISAINTKTATMRAILTFLLSFLFSSGILAQSLAETRAVAADAISGDNTLRYYRLAIAVSPNSYSENFYSQYSNVLQFWQECEDYMNEAYVPLGICFDVVTDQSLLMKNELPVNPYSGIPEIGQVTESIDNAIGNDAYDVGIWVVYRDEFDENTGLSVNSGAYSSSTKANGYAKADKWVVAHEVGHLFGAHHTAAGEGSLMDNGGDFFSYPSIRAIRNASVTAGPGNACRQESVKNNAPAFTASMKDTYRIPQGACIAIPVYADDAEGDRLRYSAIGCGSSAVGNVVENGYMPHFASLAPQASSVIDYRPEFKADLFYGNDYWAVEGTDIPSMEPGTYDIAILVNDMPASNDFDYLSKNPFYSNYAVWDAKVEIVGGEEFKASLAPAKSSYSANEEVTVSWGVNRSCFTASSRLRITMSADYGETFEYVLAESVPALDGSCKVTLPGVNVGDVDVDFVTAVRSMPGGIIRVEEIGGVAYTLTALSPMDGGSFNVTGGVDVETKIERVESGNEKGEIYDLRGYKVVNPNKGLYIIDGKLMFIE